jgi:hypothetical protein
MDFGKKDFSALVVSLTVDKTSREQQAFDMPFAKAGEKIRIDMDFSKMAKDGSGMPPALAKAAAVHRGDKKISYTLYPHARKYLVHREESGYQFEKPRVEKTKAGSEMIDNHPTDKFKVKIIYKDGRTEEGFIWNARDLGNMTIKSEVENKDLHITTQLKNISVRTPGAALFEIPPDYKEASDFMDLLMDAGRN